MKANRLFLPMLFAFVLHGTQAHAQEESNGAGAEASADSGPTPQYPQETESTAPRPPVKANSKAPTKLKIDFEDQLVKGKHDMPEAEFIFTRTQFNYKKMIKLRDNFIPEVKQGKDEFRGRN